MYVSTVSYEFEILMSKRFDTLAVLPHECPGGTRGPPGLDLWNHVTLDLACPGAYTGDHLHRS